MKELTTAENNKRIREYNKGRYDTITVWIPKGSKARWQEAASKRGVSLTKLIIDAVEKAIED